MFNLQSVFNQSLVYAFLVIIAFYNNSCYIRLG